MKARGMEILLNEDATREALGGLGRTKLYEITAAGEIDSVKIGRRRFWTYDGVERYVKHLQGNGASL